MKRFAPFIIIGLVAVLTLALGKMLLRSHERSLATRATPAATVPPKAGTESMHSLGPEKAPVVLVEYGDFQCPACASTSAVIRSIEKEYDGRLRVIFWQFPLAMHAHGREAAIAAEAASRQGHFWEMHDLLYQNQTSWARSPDVAAEFEKFALELRLNVTRFRQDLRSPATAARVDAEQEQGVSRGVKSTPTLFINEQELPPPFTPERLRAAIDAALAAQKTS